MSGKWLGLVWMDGQIRISWFAQMQAFIVLTIRKSSPANCLFSFSPDADTTEKVRTVSIVADPGSGEKCLKLTDCGASAT
jgi:hypothetical protein